VSASCANHARAAKNGKLGLVEAAKLGEHFVRVLAE
jgi:hypothetical protein